MEDEVEPFLLRIEFVVRTPRGRVVTSKGYQHLGVANPNEPTGEDDSQQALF
jgi:Holliday junction DNA helicase RuvB